MEVLCVDRITADLRGGADIARCVALRASENVASPGVQLFGAGFLVDKPTANKLGAGIAAEIQASVVRPFLNGRDIMAKSRGLYAIDFSARTAAEAQRIHPAAFQHVIDRVKPERDANRISYLSQRWWLFGRERQALRQAMGGSRRYIATPETAKHRVFQFFAVSVLPDNKLTVIAIEDAFALGVLSSRVHVHWAIVAGGRLGVGNDPVYVKRTCFDPFPFPAPTPAQAQRIRDLGEQLDAHRKARQAAHPDLTITGMYNVLEKLRANADLTDKERDVHERGLVSILRKIHDDLDAAVFDAYGWPRDLTDEQILEKLVALNAERAEEEKRGLVRWLRPDFQNPTGKRPETQLSTPTETEEETEAAPTLAKAKPWPKKLGDQFVAVRDVVARPGEVFSVAAVAGAFKGAKKKDVEGILDSFAALGVLTAFDMPAGRRWRAAGKGA